MATLTQTIQAVRRLIKDTNSNLLSDAEVTEAVNGALRRYNKDSPRILVEDVTGDGGNYYLISSVLSDWVRGFSAIIKIDYDVGSRISGDEVPYYLEPEDWSVYLSATDTEYLWLAYAPDSSTDFRVWYTTPHDHTDSADTIYDEDLDAFRWLVASVCCDILATKRAQSSDSTIGADAVAYSSKQRQFAEESDRWFAKYAGHLGFDPEEQGPEAAAGIVDWDRPVIGREFIYRGRKTR